MNNIISCKTCGTEMPKTEWQSHACPEPTSIGISIDPKANTTNGIQHKWEWICPNCGEANIDTRKAFVICRGCGTTQDGIHSIWPQALADMVETLMITCGDQKSWNEAKGLLSIYYSQKLKSEKASSQVPATPNSDNASS